MKTSILLMMLVSAVVSTEIWNRTSAPYSYWLNVVSDSTGQNLVASEYLADGSIYTSSTGGANWTKTSNLTGWWSGLASDTSGQYLAAVDGGCCVNNNNNIGYVYISNTGTFKSDNYIKIILLLKNCYKY